MLFDIKVIFPRQIQAAHICFFLTALALQIIVTCSIRLYICFNICLVLKPLALFHIIVSFNINSKHVKIVAVAGCYEYIFPKIAALPLLKK